MFDGVKVIGGENVTAPTCSSNVVKLLILNQNFFDCLKRRYTFYMKYVSIWRFFNIILPSVFSASQRYIWWF